MDNEKINKNKTEAISILDDYLQNLLNSNMKENIKKADLLSYWLKDYVKYLSEEHIYKENKKETLSYRRGSIIKANLGFNIGSEQGGLHYCLVIQKYNSKKSNVVTVVPLTSKKANKPINPLNVDLGTEIYDKLNEKFEYLINKPITEKDGVSLYTVGKLSKEISNMKEGSIALINQITTISKQRIYDPKNEFDVLYNVRISDDNLNKIDKKIKEMIVK